MSEMGFIRERVRQQWENLSEQLEGKPMKHSSHSRGGPPQVQKERRAKRQRSRK